MKYRAHKWKDAVSGNRDIRYCQRCRIKATWHGMYSEEAEKKLDVEFICEWKWLKKLRRNYGLYCSWSRVFGCHSLHNRAWAWFYAQFGRKDWFFVKHFGQWMPGAMTYCKGANRFTVMYDGRVYDSGECDCSALDKNFTWRKLL